MPAQVPLKTPAVFASQQSGYIQKTQDHDFLLAGIYTLNQLKFFWRSILHKSAFNSVLKKIPRTVLQNSLIDNIQRDVSRRRSL